MTGMMRIADSGAGWLFMVAVLCLVAAVYVAPVVRRAWTSVMVKGASRYTVIKSNTELRMLLGFVVILLCGSFFAALSFTRSVVLEAQDFEMAAKMGAWMTWAVAPASLGFCVGLAMILWDGLGRRGEHVCIALIAIAAICWGFGALLEEWLIQNWWG